MKLLTLQVILFTSDQIFVTYGMSRSTSIEPEVETVEADVFRFDTNLVNVCWYPLKTDLDLDVN